VRPHELVDAIVVHTNWETQVERLVKIIRDSREKGPGSLPGGIPGPEPGLFPGYTDSRVLPGVSRVSSESLPGPEKSQKSEKKTRHRPGPGLSGSYEGEKV
jgi:hypothetical protein